MKAQRAPVFVFYDGSDVGLDQLSVGQYVKYNNMLYVIDNKNRLFRTTTIEQAIRAKNIVPLSMDVTISQVIKNIEDINLEETAAAKLATLEATLNTKANTNETYSRTEADELFATRRQVPNAYTKDETNALFVKKVDLPDIPSTAELNSTFALKTELVNAYSKAESDEKYATKENTYTKQEISDNYLRITDQRDSYTKAETDGEFVKKVEAIDAYNKEETNDKFLTKEEAVANFARKSAVTGNITGDFIERPEVTVGQQPSTIVRRTDTGAILNKDFEATNIVLRQQNTDIDLTTEKDISILYLDGDSKIKAVSKNKIKALTTIDGEKLKAAVEQTIDRDRLKDEITAAVKATLGTMTGGTYTPRGLPNIVPDKVPDVDRSTANAVESEAEMVDRIAKVVLAAVQDKIPKIDIKTIKEQIKAELDKATYDDIESRVNTKLNEATKDIKTTLQDAKAQLDIDSVKTEIKALIPAPVDKDAMAASITKAVKDSIVIPTVEGNIDKATLKAEIKKDLKEEMPAEDKAELKKEILAAIPKVDAEAIKSSVTRDINPNKIAADVRESLNIDIIKAVMQSEITDGVNKKVKADVAKIRQEVIDLIPPAADLSDVHATNSDRLGGIGADRYRLVEDSYNKIEIDNFFNNKGFRLASDSYSRTDVDGKIAPLAVSADVDEKLSKYVTREYFNAEVLKLKQQIAELARQIGAGTGSGAGGASSSGGVANMATNILYNELGAK